MDVLDEDTVDAGRIKQEPLDATYFEDKLEIARQILRREFTREVEEREDQVVEIQQQIQTVQKCLELLRYVASCEYYSIKPEPGLGDAETAIVALHPCVQKLLPPLSIQPPVALSSSLEQSDNAQIPAPTTERQPKSVQILPVRGTASEPTCGRPRRKEVVVHRGSYKVSHQLVIGNVSKSISGGTNQPGQPTHSWMMYIRHMHDADLSTLISKVRYFLHESYKPDDIIDVKSSPFHLTRRGWGEFPVRVTIYFHHPADRPVDVVHPLKLDHTLSGTHMLGHETHIQVYLHEDLSEEVVSSPPPPQASSDIPAVEKTIGKLEELILMEHDYCRMGSSGACVATAWDTGCFVTPQRDTTEVTILNQWSRNRGPLRPWHMSQLVQAASHVVFFNTEACVRWLLKRWPFFTPHASNDLYAAVHPYSFPSYAEFYAANIGRQRAAEWYLAWKIRSVLQALNLNCWSVKQILMYCRMHGYVPYVGSRIMTAVSVASTEISTYTSHIDTGTNLRQMPVFEVQNEDVDIEGDTSQPAKEAPKKPKKCVFVRKVSGLIEAVEVISRGVGVQLGNEQVTDGLEANVSSAVLASAVKLFLEDLLRRSSCAAWLRCGRKYPQQLLVVDVVSSLTETLQFNILTNAGLGGSCST